MESGLVPGSVEGSNQIDHPAEKDYPEHQVTNKIKESSKRATLDELPEPGDEKAGESRDYIA